MRDLSIPHLRAICEAATPGPWKRMTTLDPHWLREVRNSTGSGVAFCGSFPERQAHADAVFIATARSALPALLDLVESLTAEVERLRSALVEALDMVKTAHRKRTFLEQKAFEERLHNLGLLAEVGR